MAGKCSHEESRLTCVECSAPICSNCLVECPVGFRCKKCVGEMKDPLAGKRPVIIAKTLALSVVLGFVAGCILPFIQIAWMQWALSFFVGIFAGRLLMKHFDPDVVTNTARLITLGIIVGLVLTPYGQTPFWLIYRLIGSFAGHGPNPLQILYGLVMSIFSPICFIFGVLRAAVWGEKR